MLRARTRGPPRRRRRLRTPVQTGCLRTDHSRLGRRRTRSSGRPTVGRLQLAAALRFVATSSRSRSVRRAKRAAALAGYKRSGRALRTSQARICRSGTTKPSGGNAAKTCLAKRGASRLAARSPTKSRSISSARRSVEAPNRPQVTIVPRRSGGAMSARTSQTLDPCGSSRPTQCLSCRRCARVRASTRASTARQSSKEAPPTQRARRRRRALPDLSSVRAAAAS